jgi:hypothetical protein
MLMRLLPLVFYSEARIAVTRKHYAKWLFPQGKATSHTLRQGTYILVSLSSG